MVQGSPADLANPQRVTQALQLALVHCLGVARGCCEAEMSPALPGTPQRMLTPKEEGELLRSSWLGARGLRQEGKPLDFHDNRTGLCWEARQFFLSTPHSWFLGEATTFTVLLSSRKMGT